MTGSIDELQREITRLLLRVIDSTGFALAGAGAIRAHGLTDRPTEDVDLFSGPLVSEDEFRAAVTAADQAPPGTTSIRPAHMSNSMPIP